MSEQYSNHRDTPLRRFNTFWWGLGYFGLFGLVSVLVYGLTDPPVNVEDMRKVDRLEMRSKVDKTQEGLMEGKDAGAMASKIMMQPKPSSMPIPNAAGPAPDWANDADLIAQGEKLYPAKACAGCHGPDGTKPTAPIYPSLANKDAAYLLKQMQDIKSGARVSQMTPMMKPMIDMCSDEEMKAIAAWLGSKK